MLNSKDIRELTEAEINAKIAEMEEERFRLKFRAGTETLEDPLRLRVIRKDMHGSTPCCVRRSSGSPRPGHRRRSQRRVAQRRAAYAGKSRVRPARARGHREEWLKHSSRTLSR